MNFRKILRFVIIFFILIFLSIYIFFHNNSVPAIYDFIENFDQASKFGFSKSILNTCLPNLYYDEIPIEIRNIITNQTYQNLENDNINFSSKTIIRLALEVSIKELNKHKIIISVNKKDYIYILIETGQESYIDIYELNDDKKNNIIKSAIDFNFNQISNIFIFTCNDYLLILGDDYYYRIIQDPCFLKLKNNCVFSYEGSAKSILSIKYANLRSNDLRKLYEYKMQFHRIYLKGNRPFNQLSPLDSVLNHYPGSPFIKRFKARTGVTTNSVVYIPVGSRLVYKDVLLDKKYKFYARLGFAGRNDIRRVGVFPELRMSIRDRNEKLLKSYIMTYKFPNNFWKEININIKQFSNDKYIIEFTFPCPEKVNRDQYNCVAIFGNPCLVPIRNEDEPNIVLIVLDTLRSDHLSCYDYFLQTSPNIDEFSRESILFDNHIAAAPNTIMSHRSLFTGLFPSEGGYDLLEKTFIDRSFIPFIHTLSPNIYTMADYLKSNNYYTAAFTGGLYMSAYQGFDKGFYEFIENKKLKLNMSIEIKRLKKWIRLHKDVKFFLFFHTYEIHSPYTRTFFKKKIAQYPEELRRKEVISRYDSGIYYADRNILELFNILKKYSLYDDTIIILTSDHGERFNLNAEELKYHPRSGMHGDSLYDCEIKIPLIIGGWKKLVKGVRVEKQTRNIDVLPTLLDLLDIPVKNTMSGKSLKDYFESNSGNERVAYSEAVKKLGNPKILMYSLRSNNNKIIKSYDLINNEIRPTVRWEFYDLIKDPLEKDNIAYKSSFFYKHQKILEKIIFKCEKGYTQNKGSTVKTLSDLERENNLRRLGYLN